MVLGEEDTRHMKNALRLRPGDHVEVVVEDRLYICAIDVFEVDQTVATIEKEEPLLFSPVYMTLYQGLPKSDKMDLIVQKAVELGVSDIIPVQMHRSVVKLSGVKGDKKRERWQGIAKSAAQQSKAPFIPTVHPVMSFGDVVDAIEGEVALVAYEMEKERTLKSTLQKLETKNIAVFIGPEGGFEPSEIEALTDRGAISVSLGDRILRTETAGLYMLAALSYEWG